MEVRDFMDYLGIHYDESEIQHWKYIRKYKSKSGKTVYVYADKKNAQQYSKTGIGCNEIGVRIVI